MTKAWAWNLSTWNRGASGTEESPIWSACGLPPLWMCAERTHSSRTRIVNARPCSL